MGRSLGSIVVAGAVFVGVMLADGVVRKPRSAGAATVTFQFTGTLTLARSGTGTSADLALAPDVVPGAPFTGLLTYELDTQRGPALTIPGFPPDGNSARYPAAGVTGLAVTVGGHTFGTQMPTVVDVAVYNAQESAALEAVSLSSSEQSAIANTIIVVPPPAQDAFVASTEGAFHGFIDSAYVLLQDASGSAWSSAALPALLSAAEFDVREFSFSRRANWLDSAYPFLPDSGMYVAGTIDTITLVPEPGALELGGLSLFAAMWLWRRLGRQQQS